MKDEEGTYHLQDPRTGQQRCRRAGLAAAGCGVRGVEKQDAWKDTYARGLCNSIDGKSRCPFCGHRALGLLAVALNVTGTVATASSGCSASAVCSDA